MYISGKKSKPDGAVIDGGHSNARCDVPHPEEGNHSDEEADDVRHSDLKVGYMYNDNCDHLALVLWESHSHTVR